MTTTRVRSYASLAVLGRHQEDDVDFDEAWQRRVDAGLVAVVDAPQAKAVEAAGPPVRDMSVQEVLDAVEAGELSPEAAAAEERAGRARKTLLAALEPDGDDDS